MGKPRNPSMLLHHTRITAEGRVPTHCLTFLHGIYGRGRNWTSVAKQIVQRKEDWGARLVDLRQHGESTSFDPPHTVTAAARDLIELETSLGPSSDVVLGHSFGGKVALEYARIAERRPRQVWLLDSSPDAQNPSGSAWSMLGIIRTLPSAFPTRQVFVDALVAHGYSPEVASWMGTNLAFKDGQYVWQLDFDAMEQLLLSFFSLDLSPLIDEPPAGVVIHVVKAEQSSVITSEMCERIQQAAARHGRVHLHRIAGGHWVNTDNPTAIVDLVSKNPPST